MEKRSPNLSSPLFKMDPRCLWKKLKKIIILILSVVSKNITILPMEGHWKFKYRWGSSRPKFWNEKIVYEGKIILLVGWVGVCGGGWVGVGGVGIKTLYGGNTDFMNHHTKYKNTLKTGWCDILTHPVKYKRISCQLKHTCSVLSSRPKRSRFAVNY